MISYLALMQVTEMVEQWSHGLRHRTAHESKMVNAARAILKGSPAGDLVLISKSELEDLRDKAWRYEECSK